MKTLKILGMAIVVLIFLKICHYSIINLELETFAKESLRTQNSISTEVFFTTIDVEFIRGDIKNTAIARTKDYKAVRHDYNKSKIIGVIAAQKLKEFKSGFKLGKKIPSKHGIE